MDPLGPCSTNSSHAEFHQAQSPTSHLLHDRLSACRAQSKRSRRSDFGPRRPALDDDIFLAEAEACMPSARLYDSPPAVALGSARRARVPDGMNATRKATGIRELDEQLQKLSKLNFDLKMEVFHRRQREERLQERVDQLNERMVGIQKLEEEHTELLQINDNLVKELERRDAAVKEAVEIICDLEAKNEELQDASQRRPSLVNSIVFPSDSGYGGLQTPKIIPPSSPVASSGPPHAINVSADATPDLRQSGEMPSRLPASISDRKGSSFALRDAYLEPSKNLRPVKSFISMLSERESRSGDTVQDPDIMNSPRLSVLSESSFPSIYGRPRTTMDSLDAAVLRESEQDDLPKFDEEQHRQSSIRRVSQWVNEGGLAELPLRLRETGQPERNKGLVVASPTVRPSPYGTDDRLRGSSPLPQAPAYGETMLPPTPDSFSTRLLRASNSSVADDRYLLDPVPASVIGCRASSPSCNPGQQSRDRRKTLTHTPATGNKTRLIGYPSISHEDVMPVRSAKKEVQNSEAQRGKHDRWTSNDDQSMSLVEYPNGGSIDTGTPSRFQIRHVSPPAGNMLFDWDGIDEVTNSRLPAKRRKSSAEVYMMIKTPARPDFSRAETSPSTAQLKSVSATPTNGQSAWTTKPTPLTASQRSSHTILQTSISETDIQSEDGSAKATRSTFAQKTQRLLRRMSNTQSGSPTPLRSTVVENRLSAKRSPVTSRAAISQDAAEHSGMTPRTQSARNGRHTDVLLERSDSHHGSMQASVKPRQVGHQLADVDLDTTTSDQCNRRGLEGRPHGRLQHIGQMGKIGGSRGSSDVARDAAVTALGRSASMKDKGSRTEKRVWR